MGGSVLAQADRVVGPHVDHRQLHQGREPYGWAHVVAEYQEGAAVWPQAAVQLDAVQDCAHGMLAYPEMQHTTVRVAGEQLGLPVGGDKAWLTFWGGVVGLGQVGRATP